MKKTTIALAQVGSVFLELEACLEKARMYLEKAAGLGAELVLFPEAFLSGYPRGLSFGTVVGYRSESGRERWYEYWQSAVEVPGPTTARLGEMARKARCFLVMGITERDKVSKSLYCSLLYFGPDGRLIGKHRKLKPTAAERLIWGEGSGADLCTFDTPVGKLGGLICWENYMPLARTALYQQGVEIYLAPTADNRPGWQASLQHIALEGRCFVLGCNQYISKEDYPKAYREEIATFPEPFCPGGSVVYSPLGELLAGPLYGEEALLSTTLPLDLIAKSKFDFDSVGHYARPDIFGLTIRDMPPIKKIS